MNCRKTKTFFNKKKVVVFVLFVLLLIVILSIFVSLFINKNAENNSKVNYEQKIDGLYDLIEDKNKEITNLKAKIAIFENDILKLNNILDRNEISINNLTQIKNDLEDRVEILTNTNNVNDVKIADLEEKLSNANVQLNSYKEKDQSNSETINNLNNQILNLNNMLTQLKNTNDINVATIASLNVQIVNLNAQISEMSLQSQNLQSQINSLNDKINELQASVTYYENFISSLENGEQVVATFEFDGSVYNIQIVNKGSKLSVVDPASTDYKVFNGWKVGGSAIDLSTYIINANTKIVADVTYKYDVKFKVDDTVYNSQIIIKNDCATLPTNPTKDGYEFDGWSINGVDIVSDIATKQVTQNVTYTAVFTKLHTVTFVYDNVTKATQRVKNGSYATAIIIEDTTYKIFNGWTVNGSKIDLSTYKIVTDTTFVADILYKYDVKFKVDDDIVNNQIVVKNNYATLPTTPTKDGYEFDGWSINGVDIVSDITTKKVTQNVTYVAVFTKLNTVKFMNGDMVISSQSVRNGNCATLPTNPTKDGYEFDGWSINGVDIVSDIATKQVTQNVTYVAVFTKLNTVKFMNGDTVISSQSVRNGNCATLPAEPTKDNYEFLGWSVDSVNIIDITTFEITADTIFSAMFKFGYSGIYSYTGREVNLLNHFVYGQIFLQSFSIEIQELDSGNFLATIKHFGTNNDSVSSENLTSTEFVWGKKFELVCSDSKATNGCTVKFAFKPFSKETSSFVLDIYLKLPKGSDYDRKVTDFVLTRQ